MNISEPCIVIILLDLLPPLGGLYMKKVAILIVLLSLSLVLVSCGDKAASNATDPAAAAKTFEPMTVCVKCGEAAKGEKCCKEDAAKCEKCKLNKDSVGCCKLGEAKADVVLCVKCGAASAADHKCDDKAAKCDKCGLAKDSLGCCKMTEKKAEVKEEVKKEGEETKKEETKKEGGS